MEPTRFYVRQDTLRAVLCRNHLTHQLFADHLGLSRSYWSQLFRGRRHLTPTMRRILLGSRYLEELPPASLWQEHPPPAGAHLGSR